MAPVLIQTGGAWSAAQFAAVSGARLRSLAGTVGRWELQRRNVGRVRREAALAPLALINADTVSISALRLATKVPYFSNNGHKNEKVTSYLDGSKPRSRVLPAARGAAAHAAAAWIVVPGTRCRVLDAAERDVQQAGCAAAARTLAEAALRTWHNCADRHKLLHSSRSGRAAVDGIQALLGHDAREEGQQGERGVQ
eukprot:SAG31_NODE_2077_length_6501_cov_2.482037_5_plen_196_part_00